MEVLNAKVLGSGEPLCILHGFLGMADNWKTLGGRYAESGFEVHLIDQRNHGRSFWSEAFNYELMAEDLQQYLDHHRLTEIHLLGHSMGGKTAMNFACNYPERLRKLIVADIAPKHYPPHHREILNALSALRMDTISSRSEADRELAKQLSDWGIRQFLLKNLYWVSPGKLGFRFNLGVLRNKMVEIGEALSPDCRFTGPALFIRGDRSDYVAEKDLPLIMRHFPKAEVQTVANAGHWLHAENPGQFFEKTLQFLNS